MDPKERPNHRVYLAALRRMSAEEKLRKAFELGEMARALFLVGLKRRFPERSEDDIRALALERLQACHNRNY